MRFWEAGQALGAVASERLPTAACAERIFENNKRRPVISTKSAKDTGDSIREAIATLEARVDSIATALMGTEEFARTANAASNVQLRLQKGMNAHMARQLALFNMPSREDIAALGERMMTIDDRLVRIEDMLRQMTPPAGAKAGSPPRTKKPRAKSKSAGDKKSKKTS